MCNAWCIDFVRRTLPHWHRPAAVLEVGSRDVNGTPRSAASKTDYASWTGVDLEPGPGVDLIGDVLYLLDVVRPESYDVVISTEMLEHVYAWGGALQNMWACLRLGGVFVLTTRSPGFPYHEFPCDYWRWTLADMLQVFPTSAALVLLAETDTRTPGIGVCLRKTGYTLKPEKWHAHAVPSPAS